MDPIDNLNFRKDSSTKFKLKLDNSKVKLETPETLNDADSKTADDRDQIANPRHPPKEPISKAPFSDQTPLFHDQEHYLDNMANYNARVLAVRESLQFDLAFGMAELYDLESTQLKSMQVNIPVVVKAPTGQSFYLSNNKMEPYKISAEDFVRMNISHQNAVFDTERAGFNSFAPRRRRRGTLKAFKNASK